MVVGEFNAGKSAFINALVGAEVMPEGVTPTTSVINLLRFGPEPAVTMQADGVIVREYPAEFLDEITIVDTPGTNAIIREHEQLTQQFVPRSDMVLFVTSADRPFTESERAFMASIRDWGKKIVVVINKADLLRDETGVAEVTEFVGENIERLLDSAPIYSRSHRCWRNRPRPSATATRRSGRDSGRRAGSVGSRSTFRPSIRRRIRSNS